MAEASGVKLEMKEPASDKKTNLLFMVVILLIVNFLGVLGLVIAGNELSKEIKIGTVGTQKVLQSGHGHDGENALAMARLLTSRTMSSLPGHLASYSEADLRDLHSLSWDAGVNQRSHHIIAGHTVNSPTSLTFHTQTGLDIELTDKSTIRVSRTFSDSNTMRRSLLLGDSDDDEDEGTSNIVSDMANEYPTSSVNINSYSMCC